MAIIGTLAAIGVPVYAEYINDARNVRALAELRTLEKDILAYEQNNNSLPANLVALGWTRMDPWGNAYQYLVIAGAKGVGGMRKDRFLVPLNTDFDLYSMGRDGQSRAPLSAPVSADDIIRANDGGYVGFASNY